MQGIQKLDTRQAAAYLTERGVPVRVGTLEVWRCKGRGPRYFKIGRWARYEPRDLDRFAMGQVIDTVDSREG